MSRMDIWRFLATIAIGSLACSGQATPGGTVSKHQALESTGEVQVRDALDKDRIIRPVQLRDGSAPLVIRSQVAGRQTIDCQLKAGAGQRLEVSLQGSHGSMYFNLLPPGSLDAAMAIGEQLNNHYDGLLPDDGLYTVRVFLLRSAARRQEAGRFTLSIHLSGSALQPLPSRKDALVPVTRFHASALTPCEPAYSKTRECQASVVRRSHDGTATVQLQWDGARKRRILFVRGLPMASDTFQEMTTTRNERGWRVNFGDDEHFEIPYEILTGG